jgi:hypothetical protein
MGWWSDRSGMHLPSKHKASIQIPVPPKRKEIQKKQSSSL